MPVGMSAPDTMKVTNTGIAARSPAGATRPAGIASPVGLKSSLIPKEIVEQWPGNLPQEPQEASQELQPETVSVQEQQQGIAPGTVVVEPDDGTPIEGVDVQSSWNKNPLAVDNVARQMFAPATVIFGVRKEGR